MFVRCKKRFKDGKEHRYWSVVENVRVSGGRVVQRQVLYLGEINDSQRAAWCRSIEVVEGASRSKQVALFPEDREAPELECEVVQVRLAQLTLHAPRQWGACWLALTLWERLELDRFWGPRLPASREGTRWLDIVKIQVCYRLIDPGSVDGYAKAPESGEHKIWGLTSWSGVFSQSGPVMAGSPLPAMKARCIRRLRQVTRRAGAQRRSREAA